MHPIRPERAHHVLHDVLRRAGRLALDRQATVDFELKSDGSPVSDADKEVEAFLTEELQRAFPGVGVRGEEGATVEGPEGTFWVDPIDGTQAYLDGLPYWGPAVTWVRDGELVMGGFYAPPLDEMWFAAAGAGAFRSGVRLEARWDRWERSKQVVLAPSRFHRGPRIDWRGKVRAFGSSAAHLALVASGAAVAAIVPRWSLWDVGCGALLITEVGGELVGLDGQPIDVVAVEQGLPFMAGASTALHDLADAFRRTDVG